MLYLLAFMVAMSISMALIPLMIRVAPAIGMIDLPDARKVHEMPIPRVGGVGIVIGALIPILLWSPDAQWLNSYVFGCIVLLVFGVWDDIKELGHYVKFIGQLLAVVPIVYYSDIYIHYLPLFGLDEISPVFGKPFTVFALMGMINAINHSDGLDGLAGGMATLSLVCIGYLAFMADGFILLTIVVAATGGVFGFLRFNNHPARVFMGDGGSQVLGFTLGVLAVVLTQEVNPALSPALPALFLGLPIMDILAVFWLRARGGMNWFRATKNHIHHRLLALGFDHYESVVLIYSIQILFILSAVLLSYESDWLVVSIYLGVSALIFFLLTIGEKKKWIAHKSRERSRLSNIISAIKKRHLFISIPAKIIEISIPVFFVLIALLSGNIPGDLAGSSLVLATILLGYQIFSKNNHPLFLKAIIYIAAAFIVYIETGYINFDKELLNVIEIIYFVLLALTIGMAVRYSGDNRFKVSSMDYLVVFIALFTGIFLRHNPDEAFLGLLVAKLVIIFYGSEFIINRMTGRWGLLHISTIISLYIIGLKGLL